MKFDEEHLLRGTTLGVLSSTMKVILRLSSPEKYRPAINASYSLVLFLPTSKMHTLCCKLICNCYLFMLYINVKLIFGHFIHLGMLLQYQSLPTAWCVCGGEGGRGGERGGRGGEGGGGIFKKFLRFEGVKTAQLHQGPTSVLMFDVLIWKANPS